MNIKKTKSKSKTKKDSSNTQNVYHAGSHTSERETEKLETLI